MDQSSAVSTRGTDIQAVWPTTQEEALQSAARIAAQLEWTLQTAAQAEEVANAWRAGQEQRSTEDWIAGAKVGALCGLLVGMFAGVAGGMWWISLGRAIG